jgi:wyosine [tRNA(Phe)-imidazoG37] synthetase (radical SAM superfamily)
VATTFQINFNPLKVNFFARAHGRLEYYSFIKRGIENCLYCFLFTTKDESCENEIKEKFN